MRRGRDRCFWPARKRCERSNRISLIKHFLRGLCAPKVWRRTVDALFSARVSSPDKNSSPTERTEPSQAGNKTQNASGVTTFTPLEEALGRAMGGMVHPAIRRGTRLIDLYVTHGDPAMAQRLAEAVGREYIRNSIERRASSSEEALRYLLEEEERLKRNLQKSEAAANEYKAKNPDALQLGGGTAATGSQGGGGSKGGLVEDNLQDINTKLSRSENRSDSSRRPTPAIRADLAITSTRYSRFRLFLPPQWWLTRGPRSFRSKRRSQPSPYDTRTSTPG